MHPEPVTILARRDSGIKQISDIKGKRHNIGNPGSGTRATWEVLEAALGWQRGDLKLAAAMKSAEMGQALCDNKIDSYFWLVGHPSAATVPYILNNTGQFLFRSSRTKIPSLNRLPAVSAVCNIININIIKIMINTKLGPVKRTASSGLLGL